MTLEVTTIMRKVSLAYFMVMQRDQKNTHIVDIRLRVTNPFGIF